MSRTATRPTRTTSNSAGRFVAKQSLTGGRYAKKALNRHMVNTSRSKCSASSSGTNLNIVTNHVCWGSQNLFQEAARWMQPNIACNWRGSSSPLCIDSRKSLEPGECFCTLTTESGGCELLRMGAVCANADTKGGTAFCGAVFGSHPGCNQIGDLMSVRVRGPVGGRHSTARSQSSLAWQSP